MKNTTCKHLIGAIIIIVIIYALFEGSTTSFKFREGLPTPVVNTSDPMICCGTTTTSTADGPAGIGPCASFGGDGDGNPCKGASFAATTAGGGWGVPCKCTKPGYDSGGSCTLLSMCGAPSPPPLKYCVATGKKASDGTTPTDSWCRAHNCADANAYMGDPEQGLCKYTAPAPRTSSSAPA